MSAQQSNLSKGQSGGSFPADLPYDYAAGAPSGAQGVGGKYKDTANGLGFEIPSSPSYPCAAGKPPVNVGK